MDADILRAILKSYSDDENFVHLRITRICQRKLCFVYNLM